MTKNELLSMIIEGAVVSAEMAEKAAAMLETDANAKAARKEKAKEGPSKKDIENAPLLERITNEILSAEPKTASDVAEVLEVKVQKASALLRKLVEHDIADVQEVKIPGKNKVKAYTKAAPMDAEVEAE